MNKAFLENIYFLNIWLTKYVVRRKGLHEIPISTMGIRYEIYLNFQSIYFVKPINNWTVIDHNIIFLYLGTHWNSGSLLSLLVGLLLVLGILQVIRGGERVFFHRLHSLQLVLIKLCHSKLREESCHQRSIATVPSTIDPALGHGVCW